MYVVIPLTSTVDINIRGSLVILQVHRGLTGGDWHCVYLIVWWEVELAILYFSSITHTHSHMVAFHHSTPHCIVPHHYWHRFPLKALAIVFPPSPQLFIHHLHSTPSPIISLPPRITPIHHLPTLYISLQNIHTQYTNWQTAPLIP